ncbi:MAG TPA: hypothetical protein VM940_17025 [Chthoniobacterales bacterium]|nr:hypothetical protein [Chthoniobacterales bacterium]
MTIEEPQGSLLVFLQALALWVIQKAVAALRILDHQAALKEALPITRKIALGRSAIDESERHDPVAFLVFGLGVRPAE